MYVPAWVSLMIQAMAALEVEIETGGVPSACMIAELSTAEMSCHDERLLVVICQSLLSIWYTGGGLFSA